MNPVDQLVEHFGGTQASMARALGVTRGRVQQWKRGEPIPALRALQIERLTKGKFKAAELSPTKLASHKAQLRRLGLAA